MAFTKEKKPIDHGWIDGSNGFETTDIGGSVDLLPNSLMSDMIDEVPSGNQNSPALIQREMSGTIRQIPEAEAEADRLSSGVHGSSPGDIRREMGKRLGADFSRVHFHSDSESDLRGDRIGARAWTSGSDIYFGKGGFDPQIAAHELVHTIQQGAVKGSVSSFVPAGAVQMWPWNKEKKEARNRHINTLAARYQALIRGNKKQHEKSLDESSVEFELDGLDVLPGKGKPENEKNIIHNSMSEKDDLSNQRGMLEKDNSVISGGMSEKDEILSEKSSVVAPEQDISNDLMAVSGKPGSKISKEEDNGLDTISLEGMDEVNEQEKKEILEDFVSIPGRSESDLSSNPEHEKAVSEIKDISGNLGITRNIQIGSNSAAQLGMLAENHSAMDAKNMYTSAINPSIGAVADVLGVGTGLAGLGTGAFDTYKNIKRMKAGGETSDVLTSVLDTAASGTGLVSSGFGMLSKIGSISGAPDIFNTVTDFTKSHTNVIPGLNVATGAATALSGGIQSVKGMRSISKIDSQIKELKNDRKKNGKDLDQDELYRIFKQGRRVSELNRTSGALKALSGGITAGTGIAALATGPLAPITAALAGLAGMATGLTKFIYEKVKKRRMRSDITAEDMNINWKSEMQRVRRMFPREKLSDKEVRAIILKGHGFEEGTRTSAFKEITKRRAMHLLNTAQGIGKDAGMAQKVISALGIHRKRGHYAKGALKLLTKKLG